MLHLKNSMHNGSAAIAAAAAAGVDLYKDGPYPKGKKSFKMLLLLLLLLLLPNV